MRCKTKLHGTTSKFFIIKTDEFSAMAAGVQVQRICKVKPLGVGLQCIQYQCPLRHFRLRQAQ